LHARHADHAIGIPARQSGPDRARGPHRHFGQPVSLHRLPEHRDFGARCRQAPTDRRRGGEGVGWAKSPAAARDFAYAVKRQSRTAWAKAHDGSEQTTLLYAMRLLPPYAVT